MNPDAKELPLGFVKILPSCQVDIAWESILGTTIGAVSRGEGYSSQESAIAEGDRRLKLSLDC